MATTFTNYERNGARGAGMVYEVDLADGETSVALPIQPGKKLTVTLVPASGASGSVQFTTVPPAEVATAAAAQWETWDAGTVTAITSRVIDGEATGVRFVSASGAATGRAVE